MATPPRTRRHQLPSSPANEPPPERRTHGDSYGDVGARDDALAATTSTHSASVDRRPEEPSDALADAEERLEGDA